MSPMQEVAMVATISVIVATAVTALVCIKLDLWKLRAEVQKELVNIYTPEILKTKETEKEETTDAESAQSENEEVAESETDASETNHDAVG